jgi:hypothetical protein
LINDKKVKSIHQEKSEAGWYDTNQTICWSWDKTTGICSIQLPATATSLNITIKK